MSDPRLALEAVEYLIARYQAHVEALQPAATALRELVETGEFTEQRKQALEAARPHLSAEALASVGLAPSGAALPVPTRQRADKKWFRRNGPREDDYGD